MSTCLKYASIMRLCFILVQPKSGLLQSSIISLFLAYITLTSLANEPYDVGT